MTEGVCFTVDPNAGYANSGFEVTGVVINQGVDMRPALEIIPRPVIWISVRIVLSADENQLRDAQLGADGIQGEGQKGLLIDVNLPPG